MKTLLSLILAASLLCQCTTTPGGQSSFDLNKAVLIVNITVPAAVRLGVAKQPKVEPYLKDLTLVIDTFATGTSLDPDAFIAAIASVNTSEVKNSPEYMAIIDTVVELYKATYADVVKAKIDQSTTLVPFLKALSTSIKKGLAKGLAEHYGKSS